MLILVCGIFEVKISVLILVCGIFEVKISVLILVVVSLRLRYQCLRSQYDGTLDLRIKVGSL